MEPIQLSIDVDAKEPFPDALDWKAIFSDTLEILQRLTTAAYPSHGSTNRWKISAASFSSPLHVTLRAESPDGQEINAAVGAYINGLRYLEAEEPPADPPPLFDEESLRTARHLVSPLKRGIASITFASPEFGAVTATRKIASNVDELIGVKFKAMGALEGTLETLSAKGKLRFKIYDPTTRTRIDCYIPIERLEEAKGAFLSRVAVYGEIYYAKNGKPLSIDVKEGIRRLRSRTELPQARDLEGIDITGGIDPSEYIRRMRDGD